MKEDIIQLVLEYTNVHGQCTIGDSWGGITMTELKALFGLLILAGHWTNQQKAFRQKVQSQPFSRSLWLTDFFLKMINFDDKLFGTRWLKDNRLERSGHRGSS